ncbi:MAG: hypothetical protein CSA53_01370 [Gammaproteobacteria bacterium]|nr:MAG: hypothetical protein CSA53_01370 [Gammaproteobacteria bacterium]
MKPEGTQAPVLVLDGDTLPALAIVRSLGRKGVPVIVASHDDKPICAYSRYATTSLKYPHPLTATDAYTAWVRRVLADNPGALVLPVTERTLVPLARALRNESELYQRVMMAEPQALETVLDKADIAELARACEVSLPRSWSVASMEQLNIILAELSYPVVIKPGRSISDSAQRLPLTVRYAHSEEQLKNYCAEFLQEVHVVLQEYFTGEGFGIELIAKDGKVHYAFQHQRLHEMPLTGGGSSYRMSTEIDQELLQASKRLIKALSWQGVAMVEFKKNLDTGRYIFIEINGRFWGSLPLATAAGADFPWLLYGLYTQGAVPDIPDYRRGVKVRKLSADLGWLEAVIRKDADQRLVSIPTKKQALADWLDIFTPKHYFDAQSLSDIKPGWIDFVRIIKSYWKRVSGIFAEKRERAAILAASSPERYQQLLTPDARVLLVCYGNINRSALAHCLANHLMPEKTAQFRSSGFHPVGGRPMDHRMQALAKNGGLSVDAFRSTVISEEQVNWADVIFVMEAEQVAKITQRYPKCGNKVLLLGGVAGDEKEIMDPYNKAEAVYRHVYKQIDRAVAAIAKAVDS